MKQKLLMALLLVTAQAKANSICKGTCILSDDLRGVTIHTATWTFERCNQTYNQGFSVEKTVGNYIIRVFGEPGEINSISLTDTERGTNAQFGTSWQTFGNLRDFVSRVSLQSDNRAATLICRTENVK